MLTNRLAAAALLLAACSGPDDAIDAAADGAIIPVDAAADARGPDAPPGRLDGDWRVTWTCEVGCAGIPAEPALVYSNLLTVDGFDLRWSDDDCVECVRDHTGTVFDAGCVDVPAGEEGQHVRDVYRMCEGGGTAEAVITWRSRFGGPAPTTWRAVGVRR